MRERIGPRGYPSHPSLDNLSRTSRLVSYDEANQITDIDGDTVTRGDIAIRNVVPFYYRYNSTSYSLATFCPSQTCTWPVFQTLSVCSRCRPINSALTFGCHNESGIWQPTFDPDAPPTNATAGMSCGWFFNATSQDPVLMTGYSEVERGMGSATAKTEPMASPVKREVKCIADECRKDERVDGLALSVV